MLDFARLPAGVPLTQLERICTERMRTYCRRLKTWRRMRRITLKQLSTMTGIAETTLYRIETGGRIKVSLFDILAIAHALEVELGHLFADWLAIDR